MASEMNIARIDITFDNGQKLSARLEITNSKLIINDALILPLIQEMKDNNLTTCNIGLGVNNIAVSIEDYTLTDTLYFSAFYDIPSNISIFQSKGTDVHIVNQKIDLIQLDCQTLIIANCQIRQLDVGLAEHSQALIKASDAGDNTHLTAYKMKSIDLRRCQISSVRAYVECDNINVQESLISSFNLFGGFGSKVVAEIKRIKIWHYTSINVSEIYCKVSDLSIEESTISNVVAKASCLIDKFNMDNSVIANAYNFKKKHFINLDFNTWMLISKSAQNDRNLNIKAEANYQMAKERYKNERGINKLIGKLFGFCTGYGFKPMRAFLSCIILITASFLIITIKNLICQGFDAIKSLINNIAISFSAIAGQSGLKITDGFEFWIAIFEYVIGLLIFAMFVNALYVRYKD